MYVHLMEVGESMCVHLMEVGESMCVNLMEVGESMCVHLRDHNFVLLIQSQNFNKTQGLERNFQEITS